ncbi:phage tail protein [Actinoplanes ianthinogenes]|uniref:Phage tail protein n=1 Tax=Actinoplanes ianthinogenes TaxID=122358 RepID=A0ABM7LKQ0_9ACTN|nr:phage tail protein [Actinoplanes ianthinogenes]BCJ39847.1 phage tail protein [Actinoplanes ianthinogenes]GGR08552.1 phage tail protein [Actinoplanes ianthinogenes]
MAVGERKDPFAGFNFRVRFDRTGPDVAAFREVTGLTFTTAPIEYRAGTDPALHVRKLTGLRTFGNLTLRRGITTNRELWTWYRNVLNGLPDRRGGEIALRDEQQADVLVWTFADAFICKWQGPALNATTNEIAIEEVEICVERVELQ